MANNYGYQQYPPYGPPPNGNLAYNNGQPPPQNWYGNNNQGFSAGYGYSQPNYNQSCNQGYYEQPQQRQQFNRPAFRPRAPNNSDSRFGGPRFRPRGAQGFRPYRPAASAQPRYTAPAVQSTPAVENQYTEQITASFSPVQNEPSSSPEANFEERAMAMAGDNVIPDAIRQTIPTEGTTASQPVRYSQQDAPTYTTPQVAQPYVSMTSFSEVDETTASDNVYSLANKYNSVCLEGSRGFPNSERKQLPPRASKPPPAKQWNFEENTAASPKFHCDLCDVNCQDEATFFSHFISRKHLNKETNLKQVDEAVRIGTYETRMNSSNESLDLRCNICSQCLPSVELYKLHLTGLNHKQSIGDFISQDRAVPRIVPTILSSIDPERKTQIEEEIQEYEQVLKQRPKEIEATAQKTVKDSIGLEFVVQVNDSQEFSCLICDVKLNGDRVIELHCKGQKHRNRLTQKLADPDFQKEISVMVDGEDIPIEERTNWQDDCKHYSVDPDPMLPFEAFIENCDVPKPISPSQMYGTSSRHCSFIKCDEQDHYMDTRGSEITYARGKITEMYLHLKYLSRTVYIITFGINTVLLDFRESDRDDERFEKCCNTANNVVPESLLKHVLDTLPPKHSCYYTSVVRTGVVGKGYILNDEQLLEVVVLCKFPPTTEVLRLFEVGFNHILNRDEKFGREISVIRNDDEGEIRVLYMRPDLSPMLEVKFSFTSSMFRMYSPEILNRIPNILNREKCLRTLAKIRQMRWFKEKHIYYPFFTFVIRVLRDYIRRNPMWRVLDLYMIELVLDHLLRSCQTLVTPSILLRNFFKFFSQVHLNTQSYFGDICEPDYPNPFGHLTDEECANIMNIARITLELLQKKKIWVVLHRRIRFRNAQNKDEQHDDNNHDEGVEEYSSENGAQNEQNFDTSQENIEENCTFQEEKPEIITLE